MVVKHPGTLLHIYEKGVKLEKINVGGLYFKEGRRQLSKTVYVDPEMEEIFRKLNSYGVALENRTTPYGYGRRPDEADVRDWKEKV